MIPASVHELPTLLAVLEARGEEPAPAYRCGCGRCAPPEGFVSTEALPGELPAFVCHTCASGPHRRALALQAAQAAAAGDPDWSAVRAERNMRLARCDWTQMPDVGMSEERRAAWAAYRVALRNITATAADPESVVWPDAPS